MLENDEVPMDYNVVLDDLQRQLRAGQARFEAWETEKAELLAAMDAIRKLANRHGSQQQIALPGIGGKPVARSAPHTFRGLSYKDATKKVFGMFEKPLTAPDVTDVLFNAGFASSRRLIKSNIDGVFKRLRDDRVIERVGETPTFRLAQTSLVESNGQHP